MSKSVELRERVAALESDPDLFFVPVRHHSPQCARATQAIIEEMRPDTVLIEGPSEANHLLALLADESAQPPLAIYVYAVEGKATGSRPAVRYRCFAPLAAMSPEWVALRTAARLGVEARFIDLPYAGQLARRESPEEDVSAPEPLFSDDGLLARADPLARLVAAEGARDFDEWWDRTFESGRDFGDARAFCREMHHFCTMLRLAQPRIDEETAAREAHMARAVRTARAAGERCVVVTGGFHAIGIQDLVVAESADAGGDAGALCAETAGESGALETGVHVVRYSLARLSTASGYAAGLPDVGYYDVAWQMLNRRREPRPFGASNRLTRCSVASAIQSLIAVRAASGSA